MIMSQNKFTLILLAFNLSPLHSEEEEIYLKSISDQIQVITKDLKTLEKAIYKNRCSITTKSNGFI